MLRGRTIHRSFTFSLIGSNPNEILHPRALGSDVLPTQVRRDADSQKYNINNKNQLFTDRFSKKATFCTPPHQQNGTSGVLRGPDGPEHTEKRPCLHQ